MTGPAPADPRLLAEATVAAAWGGTRSVVGVEAAVGGYSGGVYAVRVDNPDQTLALRRHRGGSAACAAEVAIADRLRGVVPVPAVVYADPDGTDPVTLAEWVDAGLLETVLPTVGRTEAAELGAAVGTTLAAIGTISFASSGFFTGPDLTVGASLGAGNAADGLRGFVDARLGESPDPLLTAYADLVRRDAAALDDIVDPPVLVHADYNPKNILVRQVGGHWQVAAVIDWEFAFAGWALTDVANMLRHPETLPAGYPNAFVAAFRAAGGRLSDGWERRARVLDVFALVGFLTADPPAALTPPVRAIAARCVDRGWI